MRRLGLLLLIFCSISLLAGCGGGSSTDNLPGAQPPPDPADTTVASLAFNDPSSTGFSAQTSDSPIRLTVSALNAAGDGIDGASITLTTDIGELDDLNGQTGSSIELTTVDGSAEFNFQSGLDKANSTGVLTANSGSIDQTQTVKLTGSTLSLDPSGFTVRFGETQTVTATALDAAGDPITSEFITLNSDFQGELASGLPDNNGQFSVDYVAGNTSDIDTITASGAGTSRVIQANISDQEFAFVSPASGAEIPRNGTQQIVFRSSDDTGAGVANEQLEFSALFGTFVGGTNLLTATPDSTDGRATVTYQAPASPTQNEVITVTSIVSGARGSYDDLPLTIVALDPASLTLTANPDTVATNSASTLTVTVKDNGGFPVQGTSVQLQLLSSPGDVSLSSFSVTTDSNGQATSTFTSGSTTTAVDAVEILARVANNPTINDQVFLTIGQPNVQMRLSPANLPEISGSASYSLIVSVYVADFKGTAVTDQSVSLSMTPTFFRTGEWLDRNDETVIIPAISGEFPNEDTNHNGVLDAGEDGAFGFYDFGNDGSFTGEAAYYHDAGVVHATKIDADLNGQLDPGLIGTITSQVTTDTNGFAEAIINYPKSMGQWVDVEVTATTTVSGNVITKSDTFTLPILPSDVPRPIPPFGP